MDGDRFDNLSRRLATAVSRRQAVKGAAAGLLGAIGLRKAADAQVTQAYCGNVPCAGNPGVCKSGCVCCVFSNGNSRCMPPNTCSGTIVTTTTTTTTAAPTTTTTTAAPTTTTTTTPEPTTTTTTTACPTAVCGGFCCPPGNACCADGTDCSANGCCPNAVCNGDFCCPPGNACCTGGSDCSAGGCCPNAVCGDSTCCPPGNACCTTGSQCVDGCCPGAVAGTDCCESGESNFGGVCCDAQANVCGSECCTAGQVCDTGSGTCVECVTSDDCSEIEVCVANVCLLGFGQTCAEGTECASDTCCADGTAREGLCGLLDGESCSGSNNECCSGSCNDGVCGQPGSAGAACDVGDDADCEAALTCCDNLTQTGADFICRDLTSDPNNCGTCNNVCPAGTVCDGGACLLDLGQTCAASAECASDTCCADGTARAGLCGLVDGQACGQNNNACCSGACVGGICAQKGAAGAVCDVGDVADCQAGLACCDSATNDPGDFVCRDLTSDPNNCGACGTVCPAGQICEVGVCVCAFEECDSGCCPNETDVCIGAAGSTTCGSPQPLGTACFADDGQCASGNCARVQNISSGNVAVCCSPIGGPCNGSATTNNQCCDDGIDGTNTSGNAAACSSTGTNPGVCCVSNNFACASLSQCCQQGSFGACAPTDGVQRCCLIAGGFCGGGIRCCDGFTCNASDSCVAV